MQRRLPGKKKLPDKKTRRSSGPNRLLDIQATERYATQCIWGRTSAFNAKHRNFAGSLLCTRANSTPPRRAVRRHAAIMRCDAACGHARTGPPEPRPDLLKLLQPSTRAASTTQTSVGSLTDVAQVAPALGGGKATCNTSRDALETPNCVADARVAWVAWVIPSVPRCPASTKQHPWRHVHTTPPPHTQQHAGLDRRTRFIEHHSTQQPRPPAAGSAVWLSNPRRWRQLQGWRPRLCGWLARPRRTFAVGPCGLRSRRRLLCERNQPAVRAYAGAPRREALIIGRRDGLSPCGRIGGSGGGALQG